MADLTITPALVKLLPGAQTRKLAASEVIDVGELVYVDANGEAALADGSAAGTVDDFVGIVTNIGTEGATTAAIGDMLTVVYAGPVSLGDTTLTPGRVFVSDTAGKVADASGTVKGLVGVVINNGVLIVNPVVPI